MAAIAGSLEEFAFDEVVMFIGKYSGKLTLCSLSSRRETFEMHIQDMTLQAMFVDQQALTEPAAALDAIVTIMSAKEGLFEFEPTPASELSQNLDIMLPQVMLDAATALDEFKESLKNLINQKTVDSIFTN